MQMQTAGRFGSLRWRCSVPDRCMAALAREMASRLGCSPADARAALEELCRAGWLVLDALGVVLPLAPRTPIAEGVRVL